MSELDKKTLVHIAGEVVVVGGITAYLINRIGALEARVAELEKDLQAAARHAVATERKQNEVLGAMSHLIKTSAKPHEPHHGHSHHTPVVRPPAQASARPAAKPPVSSHKKTISFSDDLDDDVDEGDSGEVEVVTPVKTKTKPAGKSKGIKVAAPPPENGRARKDMSDVKAAAAKLAPSDDEQ